MILGKSLDLSVSSPGNKTKNNPYLIESLLGFNKLINAKYLEECMECSKDLSISYHHNYYYVTQFSSSLLNLTLLFFI